MSVPTAARAVQASCPLLDYRPGGFFFSSPEASLLAEEPLVVSAEPADTWSDVAAGLLAAARAAGQDDPIVVGALGFAPQTPPRLVVPRVVRWGRPPRWLPDVPAAGGTGPWSIRSLPQPEAFRRGVRRALDLIDAGALEKVVLARSLQLDGAEPIPVAALLRRLADRNACGYVFAADVTGPADPAPRTLLGATPELLVSRRGDTVVSNPLAGSAPRHPDPVADRANATALMSSEKDRREHAVVIDEVRRLLAPQCRDVVVRAEPVLVRTAAMWHLSTRITGSLRDPATTSLELAQALHPTPAVGGRPLDAAVAAIGEIEGFDRGYYTGLVGWTDERGDGEWAIVLRCAEALGGSLQLYAGGGIVAGSDPAAELAETSAKLRTFLDAVGLEATP